jgi:DUF4097 and DUF4098 domain-containing protein YvlB
MSEEKKEILRMLSEGIIDVDGAERLLKALDEGDRRRDESRRFARPERPGRSMFESVIASVTDAVSGIGPAVREAMTDECDMEDFDGEVSGKGSELETESGAFAIPQGREVRIVHASRKAPGNLSIRGVEGSDAIIEPSSGPRVFDDGKTVTILWKKGDLEIGLPPTAGDTKAKSLGGNVSVRGLSSSFSVRTMGGNLDIEDVSGPFQARTMGGNVGVVLRRPLLASSAVTTMGGGIDIRIEQTGGPGLDLETMGGMITGNIPACSTKRPGRFCVVLHPDREIRLSAKTMGGDIDVRNDENE